MNSLNFGFHGISLSPILTVHSPPTFTSDFENRLSRDGSSYSFTSWRSTIFPFLTAWLILSIYFGSVISRTIRLFVYVFLIQLLAWVCGSIFKTHLDPFVIMTPFSVEKLSIGSPSTYHDLCWAGVDKKSLNMKPAVWGTPSSLILWSQQFMSFSLYSAGKGPFRLMKAADRIEFPVRSLS